MAMKTKAIEVKVDERLADETLVLNSTSKEVVTDITVEPILKEI